MSPTRKSAGYSGTPLAKKLGIKASMKVLFDRAPDGFDELVAPLPEPLDVRRRVADGLDLVVTFHTSGATLRRRVATLRERIARDGAIWIAWPKKASGVETDITEDRLREWFLPGGELVDIKVCAIDETWSGLKFVIRAERR